MTTVYFPAIIERGQGGFGVVFPDLPGCTSAGKSLQEAARNAEEALGGHLVAMADYGDPIPDPGDLDTLEADPDIEEAARILVRAERPGKKVRINVMLDEGLVSAIDAVADNRSKFLSEAAIKVLRAGG